MYLQDILATFTPGERLLLYVLSIVLGVSTCSLVIMASDRSMVSVPTHGGSIVEGEIGPLRFINPILALSDADQDATMLVYSGLMQTLPDGSLRPRLASSYTESSDGLVYTFHLRPHVVFQDGTPVTSADVAYTIAEIQDPNNKSPQAANWSGVTVTTPDPYTVTFTLTQPYSGFLHNTTLGIVPKHIWSKYSSEELPFAPENVQAIGSGPFSVSGVTKDQTGAITRVDLTAFKNAVEGAPYLDSISLSVFASLSDAEHALASGAIDTLVDSSSTPPGNGDIIRTPLPRVFGIFFNQNHDPALTDVAARQALISAIDVPSLISSTLGQSADVLSGPIPANTFATISPLVRQAIDHKHINIAQPYASTDASIAQAQDILLHAGWKQDPTTKAWSKNKKVLSIDIATADTPALVSIAQAVSTAWNKVGVVSTVSIYSLSDLESKMIRPRAYDSILFGEAVGPQLDLYAFWYSKERNDPGLNLALYANTNVDTNLLRARTTTSTSTQVQYDQAAAQAIVHDNTALFLYSPQFSYILPTTLQGVTFGPLMTPADRFQNVSDWYLQTERVWRIFASYVR